MRVSFSRLMGLSLGLALMCAFGLISACSTGGTASTTTPGSTVPATTTTPGGGTSAHAILNRAEHSSLKDASFSISASAGAGSGPVPGNAAHVSGTGQLTMSPHRTEFDFSAIGLFGVSAPATMIVDENKNVYAKVPPLNQWVKVDPNQLSLQIGTLDILNYDQIQNPTLIGGETLNGQQTWHVQGVVLAQTDAVARRLEDVWVRQSDAYPVQMQIHTVPDPHGTPTTDNRVLNMTLQFQQWDTGIAISLPENPIAP